MELSTFSSELFACRDHLHIMHLKSKSYSEHKALKHLYESVIDFADQFIESFTGFLDKDVEFDTIVVNDYTGTPISYIEEFLQNVLFAVKYDLSSDMNLYGWAVNDIESLIQKCYHTIYKLRNLS